MKKRKLIILSIIATLVCTSTLSFADEIKTIRKNQIEYIPIEAVVKKAGGNINKNKNKININLNNKSISLKLDNSFAKINDKYYPIETMEVDGFLAPKNTKLIEQNNKTYIEKDFFKSYKIIDYKIKDNVITINSAIEIQATTSTTESEEDDTQETTQTSSNNNVSINRPNRPTRPSIGSNANNNNNASSNIPSNESNNSNNDTNNDNLNDENDSSNNSNSDNTSTSPDIEEPTIPDSSIEIPSEDESSGDVSSDIVE